jgi:hypothetical protein
MRLLGSSHELEVHQIELECRMKHYYWPRAMDKSKQSELYDLLPSSYFTSIKGDVLGPNLSGSELLGKSI